MQGHTIPHVSSLAFVVCVAAVVLAAAAINAEVSAESSVQQAVSSADVIVIGAGVAGIAAAAALQQRGATVIVLEARYRPYGRLNTVKPAGWPIPIEVMMSRMHSHALATKDMIPSSAMHTHMVHTCM